jgi:hypothetical protein
LAAFAVLGLSRAIRATSGRPLADVTSALSGEANSPWREYQCLKTAGAAYVSFVGASIVVTLHPHEAVIGYATVLRQS